MKIKRLEAFLVPLKDLIVRDPITKSIMPEKGLVKPLVGKEGRYWKRRIRDGSVKISNVKIKKQRKTLNKTEIKTENKEK